MKKIALPIQLREFIAAVLAVSCTVFALPLRSTSAARASSEVKSETQYRSEAARFTRALSAVAAIATMKLETGDDLKKAIAILDRERPNLKLHRSKLITIGLSDSTFTGAIKKRAPEHKSAEALLKEIQADPKTVFKLEGAESLKTRIQRSAEADAATLRRVAERLKEAAEKIKKASQERAIFGFGVADNLKLARVNFSTEREPVTATKTASPPQTEILAALIITFVVVSFLAGYIQGRLTNHDLQDQVVRCQEGADHSYSSCVSDASDLPSGFPFFEREVAQALCYSEWLAVQSLCIVAG
jgi:hypothetical protein